MRTCGERGKFKFIIIFLFFIFSFIIIFFYYNVIFIAALQRTNDKEGDGGEKKQEARVNIYIKDTFSMR